MAVVGEKERLGPIADVLRPTAFDIPSDLSFRRGIERDLADAGVPAFSPSSEETVPKVRPVLISSVV